MAKLLAFMQRCFGRSPERLVPVFRVPAKDEGYPKDITPEEAEMGFQRLLIDGIGNWKEGRMLPEPVPVVARILSASDVVIKARDPVGLVRYWHYRCGYYKSLGGAVEWHSLSTPTADAKQLIYDFSFQVHGERIRGDCVGVSFRYHAA